LSQLSEVVNDFESATGLIEAAHSFKASDGIVAAPIAAPNTNIVIQIGVAFLVDASGATPVRAMWHGIKRCSLSGSQRP